MTLMMAITREVKPQEIVDLVWGTGALSWEWWDGAAHQRYSTSRKKWLSVAGEEPLDGDAVVFTIDDPEEPEGSGKTLRKRVTMQQIADAASWALGAGYGQEDAKDMMTDSLGYADASMADLILQKAVFGEVIYG